MGREIPSLRALCLRMVGNNACNPEKVFETKKKKLSSASKLLRSFHQSDKLSRIACSGKGSVKRSNANDVDLNHPFIATSELLAEHGNPSLDCLQSYIDSLVELGRLDDSKLGVNFWSEWKEHVTAEADFVTTGSSKKRKRSAPKIGSLSLHNGSIGPKTVRAMVKSGMGEHVGVLDLTGSNTLTDSEIEKMLKAMPNLQRLSLKNCRRLSGKSLVSIAHHSPQLKCLDVGGSYNMTTAQVLEILPSLPKLEELYASGLGWNDLGLEQLTEARSWKGLGIGFSPLVTAKGIRDALSNSQTHLERLAIPFCEQAVDNGLLGFLGRSLSAVSALDIRGNPVNSMTFWLDGRTVEDAVVQELFVLARYTNITKASLEETKRVHPVLATGFQCVIDGTGVGEGIRR